MGTIRACRDEERPAILTIVNAAAEAYRGVIPPDRWHEPYMPAGELAGEIAAGVAFWGYEADGALVGVMGIQPVGDLDHLHAAVAADRRGDPRRQRPGAARDADPRAADAAVAHECRDDGARCRV